MVPDLRHQRGDPLFAGIVGPGRPGGRTPARNINPALYAMSPPTSPGIVDVTSGNNTVTFTQDGALQTVTGFPAGPVTTWRRGWGRWTPPSSSPSWRRPRADRYAWAARPARPGRATGPLVQDPAPPVAGRGDEDGGELHRTVAPHPVDADVLVVLGPAHQCVGTRGGRARAQQLPAAPRPVPPYRDLGLDEEVAGEGEGRAGPAARRSPPVPPPCRAPVPVPPGLLGETSAICSARRASSGSGRALPRTKRWSTSAA